VTRLLPLVLLAQLAGVAGVDVSDNHEIDFARPTVSVLVGAEYVAPRWEAALIGNASRARKQELASGQAYGACMTALAKPWGMLLVGVCLGYQYTASPIWSKYSWRPCAVGGVDLAPWGRITVRHVFVGTDEINESTDDIAEIRVLLARKTRLGLHVARMSFHGSYNPGQTFTRGAWGMSLAQTF
jgi:hypothetical protein